MPQRQKEGKQQQQKPVFTSSLFVKRLAVRQPRREEERAKAVLPFKIKFLFFGFIVYI